MAKPDVRKYKGLYALTDDGLLGGCLLSSVEAVLEGGCRIVQYRSKQLSRENRLQEAASLVEVCHQRGAWLLVNDDPLLAIEAGADGVHLGQYDMPLAKARRILGADAVIGVTCHADLSLAIAAAQGGADYVAFGRFFDSGTKPDASPAPLSILSTARDTLSCPVVAIGGITLDNARSIFQAGADMVAVTGGLFADTAEAPVEITARARAFQSLFAG